jgi:hypothetical protein
VRKIVLDIQDIKDTGTVLWIRLQSDLHHFAGSETGLASRAADPDPEMHPSQPNVKKNYTFFQKISIHCQKY